MASHTYEIEFQKIALHYKHKNIDYIITAPKIEETFEYTREERRNLIKKCKKNINTFFDIDYKTKRKLELADINRLCKQIYLLFLLNDKHGPEEIPNFDFKDTDRENIFCIRPVNKI
jgi:hypothetical protein